jgi:prepilin peptidase CpaA
MFGMRIAFGKITYSEVSKTFGFCAGLPPGGLRREKALHSIAWWPTMAVLAIAVFTDLRSGRIPNWLVLPFLVIGIAISGWQNGWAGVGRSMEGILLGTVLFGFFYLLGGMGMGDVKLCAAIGAWIGPLQLLTALVLTGLAGGVMAIAWAIRGKFVGELFKGSGDLLFRRRGKKPEERLTLSNPLARKMPYAPAIAIGTLISFFSR